MSKKQAIIIGIVVTLLIGGGVTFYALRNINEKPPVTVDQTSSTSTGSELTDETQEATLKGTLKGTDELHWGKGSIEVVETQNGAMLVFKDDFEVAQGPDLFIYLSPNPADEELGEFASLGHLKANKGSQEYNLPDNYKDYKTVVVWCRAFGVTFATAELQ